jgi:hypothetical protein
MTTKLVSLASVVLPVFFAAAGFLCAAGASATPPGEWVRARTVGPDTLVAQVRVAGATAWMLVDTGATRSRIRADLAARLALRPTARHALTGLDGSERAALCHGPIAVEVGAQELMIDCLSWSAELPIPLGLDGVLGADALLRADVLLDPSRGLLRIAPPGALGPWTEGARIPAYAIEGRPAIAVRWDDPQTAVAADGRAVERSGFLVLDSGTDATILFGDLARSLAQTTTTRPIFLETAGGTLRASAARSVSLRLAGHAPASISAVLLPRTADREEVGVVPLSALGPVLLSLSDGVVVANARLRRQPTLIQVAAWASGRPAVVAP